MMNATELKRLSNAVHEEHLRKEAEEAERIRQLIIEETRKTCELIGEAVEAQAASGASKIYKTFLFRPGYGNDHSHFRLLGVDGHYANGTPSWGVKFEYVSLDEVISFLKNHGLDVSIREGEDYWVYGCGHFWNGILLKVSLDIR